MSKICLIMIAIFSSSAFAKQTEISTEFLGSSDCNYTAVDNRYNRLNYLTNVNGDIKIDLEMEDAATAENMGRTDEYRTPVISTLKAVDNQIIHMPSSTICAVFEKTGLIGKKEWNPKSFCTITTVEVTQKSYDHDGFENDQICTRSYFLRIFRK